MSLGDKKLRIPLVIGIIIIIQISACSSSSEDNSPITTDLKPSPIALSNANFQTDQFSGAKNCGICHNGLRDENDVDVSIELDWNSTMMANAARDPLFRAKMASETLRNPSLKSLIENKCSRCHTPMANVEAHSKDLTIGLLPPGFLSENHELYDAAMDGVSCTVCHQIENSPNLGTESGFTGQFTINSLRSIYGPFIDPLGENMEAVSSYTPLYSSHISSSKLCSACHNLYTNVIDIDTGQDTGEIFPEQNIYNEWEQSSFSDADTGKSCQDCHMPETNGVKVSTLGPASLTNRDNFSKHYFVGGNTYMLDIFNRNKTTLGVSGNNFDESINRTRSLLQSSANLSLQDIRKSNGLLNFTVQVKNKSGHKLPSGYPARRAYLHVTVKNSSSEVVFESGKLNADGSISGVDSDEDADKYEQHHDLITNSNQVQVYESIMGDTNNQITYTLLNGATYLKDNRILPDGFDKNTATADVSPDAETLADQNFLAASDSVTYQISLDTDQNYNVEIELNYQSLAYRYAQDLFKDIDKHEYINMFKTLYDDPANIRKETIATLNKTIEGDGTNSDSDNNSDNTNGEGNPPNNSDWTEATLAIESIQDKPSTPDYNNAPQIIVDNSGNTITKFTIIKSNLNKGSNISVVENFISQSQDGIEWQNLLTNSTLFEDLTTAAYMESIHVVSLTGDLYTLIRDTNMLYLARYVESSGWTKIEIPNAPINIEADKIQISSTEAGAITVVWLENIPNSFNASINATHYMVTSGWGPIHAITIAYDKILSPHFVDAAGNIHISWLVGSDNDLEMKMAIYTAMQGWSEIINGPTDIQSTHTKSISDQHHRVILDIDDTNNHRINAYVVAHDGNWTKFTNINQKQDGDQITLTNWNDVAIAIGDLGQLIVAWNETNHSGSEVIQYYKSATAFPQTDQATNLLWSNPITVSNLSNIIESDIKLAISNNGDFYSVWSGDTNKIYVNHASSDGVWDQTPHILADYSLTNNIFALKPQVVAVQDKVRITWNQLIEAESTTTQNIWTTQNQ